MTPVGTLWYRALRRVERRALRTLAAYAAGGSCAAEVRQRERAELLLRNAVRTANRLSTLYGGPRR